MPRVRKRMTQRRIQILFGLLLVGILYAEFAFDSNYEPIVYQGTPVLLAAERVDADSFEHFVRNDPLSALLKARERLVRESRDYACTFVKQERLPTGMCAEQEVEVKFRPEPYSVMMNWIRNAGLTQRAIYVKGKWVDEDASDPDLREMVVCQPTKMTALIVGNRVTQPIHGFFAKRTSRRYIDEFGFKRALDLLIKYCELAKSRNELSLVFKGESHFDGRPVWVIRRHLPYKSEGGRYPDRVADVYIDKEHQVPVAVYCYSDDDREPRNLLGKYEYRNIRFDAGLTERDFDPDTYGM